jgi:hypothetical protein
MHLMSTPQQPEIHRSDLGASEPSPAKLHLDLHDGGDEGSFGPVPEANRPGHRPEHEQDKPDLDAFAARLGVIPVHDAQDADPGGGERADAGDRRDDDSRRDEDVTQGLPARDRDADPTAAFAGPAPSPADAGPGRAWYDPFGLVQRGQEVAAPVARVAGHLAGQFSGHALRTAKSTMRKLPCIPGLPKR